MFWKFWYVIFASMCSFFSPCNEPFSVAFAMQNNHYFATHFNFLQIPFYSSKMSDENFHFHLKVLIICIISIFRFLFPFFAVNLFLYVFDKFMKNSVRLPKFFCLSKKPTCNFWSRIESDKKLFASIFFFDFLPETF